MAGHPTPFTNAFNTNNLNSLRYNVAQYGSPIPILWGTNRVSPNVIEEWGFSSTGSAKGKSKGKSGSKNYKVNAAFGFCIGPVNVPGSNLVWNNQAVQNAGSVPLTFYQGNDGQAPDPVFASSDTNTPVIGYSGIAYATGTPIQLGNAPVLPNVSVEITGFRSGTAGASSLISKDCNPQFIVSDILNDPRVGIGFPSVPDLSDWGNFCQANLFGFALLCDRHQPAKDWIEELCQLTTSAIFWSSGRLRIVPYSINMIDQNDAVWVPNTTPVYDLTDDDYLPWSGGTQRSPGDKDPVLITRADVSQLVNWMSVEILDRGYWYNPSLQPPVYDQASIDLYGVRSQASVQAHEIVNPTVGYNAALMMLSRKLYLRNTYRFRVGWRHMLLEPMDVVTLTDSVSGLGKTPVRIIEVQEDDQGALTMMAEDLV